MKLTGILRHISFVMIAIIAGLSARAQAQQNVRVYIDARLPLEDKSAIKEMIGFLKQSSGSVFIYDSISRFSGSGIYATIFPIDSYKKAPAGLRAMGDEGAYIQGSSKHLYITANSSLGLREALFTYLEKLGFRFYFPDPAWFIIPSKRPALIPIEQLSGPDFASREMFMGFGYGSEKLQQRYAFWQKANRMGGAMTVRNEHAYYGLVNDNKDEFQRHPEFLSLPLVKGARQYGAVLNYGNPALAQLAYQWLAKTFDNYEKKGIHVPMLSLEPFDGNNYCDLPACRVAGQTASDQVFYFTNEVAKRLRKTHPTKKIGILAYNDHIDIPKYKIEDNIFVTITNGYNTSRFSTDELIARWKTKVSTLGIYDYLSIYASSSDLPGAGLGGNYQRVGDLVKKYSDAGIVAYKAETTYGWIPKGLSHYLVARLTWDKSLNISSIVDEFFDLCFPTTKKWIRPVFDYWNTKYIMNDDDLYQWFTALSNAFNECDDPVELERLHQFALYIYYVKLLRDYRDAPKAKTEQHGLELTTFLWNVLDKGVVASAAALNTLSQKMGKDYDYFNPKARWRTNRMSYPRDKREWLSFIGSYLPTLQHTEPVREFNIIPELTKEERAQISLETSLKNSKKVINFRGELTFIMNTAMSDSLFLRVWAGREKRAGRLILRAYKWNNEMKISGQSLKEYSFEADMSQHIVSFATLARDRYIVSVTDGSSGGSIYFPEKLRYSVLASASNPISGGVGNAFFFYVPKGTKSFYILKSHFLRVFDPNKKFTDYSTAVKMVKIEVNDKNAGWWMANLQLESLYFKGIPPLISRDPTSFYFP